MYCVNCGVKLADSESKCPLCGTVVFHPDIPRESGDKPYPPQTRPAERASRDGLLFLLTLSSAMALVIVFLCDWRVDGSVTWSGYPMGAILLLYVFTVVPLWSRSTDPTLFLAMDFAATALYLLFIDRVTGGGWFFPFALPVVLGLLLITVVSVGLMYRLRRGYLYIISGLCFACGGFAVLTEARLNAAFGLHDSLVWSFYPLCGFILVGGMLLIIARNDALRETLRRKFFI